MACHGISPPKALHEGEELGVYVFYVFCLPLSAPRDNVKTYNGGGNASSQCPRVCIA